MSSPLKTPVDAIQIGMYVSQLDRPWLETPFLFQGFLVRGEDDIIAIRRHCEFVYVDQTQSAVTAGPAVESASAEKQTLQPQQPKKRSLFARLTRRQPAAEPAPDYQATGSFYRDTTGVETELIPAKAAHDNATEAIEDLFAVLKTTNKLDMGRLATAVDPMIDSVLRNQDAMACLARMKRKDDYLYSHSLASSVWALLMGRHLGLDRESLLAVGLGAMLLDVGKTQLPTELLTKKESLTPAERKLMQGHVAAGIAIVQNNPKADRRVLEMVANHHERHNGTGYPRGLAGNDVPVYGRIAGLVDAYDAMTTQRPYAAAMSSLDAMRQFRLRADADFQSEMVEQFIQAIGAFPTGTLVELNTGEVGIVMSQNQLRRLRPTIMIVLDAAKQLRKDFPLVDLSIQTKAEDDQASLWIERGLEPCAYGIDPAEFYLG